MRIFRFLVTLLMLSCNTSVEKLPILSYTINDKGVKEFYTISYSGFTNQLNEDFSTEHLSGKISVANFFFTRCPSICPPMRNALISLAKAFEENEDFLIISHTIDPNHDTVSVLNSYAKATGVNENHWQFIRASTEKTKAQAKQYMTDFRPNEDGTDFYHSSYVALIDKTQQIRGFYNLLVGEDLTRLKTDITHLLQKND